MADNNHSTLRSLFSDIANSIRRKTEWTNNIIADTFPEAIDKINWDATISSGSQLMNGVIAYGNNGKYVGSIQSKTENDLVVNGPNVTVLAGYYGNNATASVATTTHPDPTVGYNLSNINNGIVAVNASHTQNTGYVVGNTTSAVTNVNIGIATINNPSGSKTLNKPSIELNKSTGVVTTSSESVNVTAYANTTNNGYTTNKTRSGNVVITGNTNTLNIGLSNPTASTVIVNGSTVSGYVSGNDGYTNSFNIPITGTVSNGALVSSVTSHTNTNPSVTVSHSGNISTIGTTTKPSGTAGTDYYQIGFSNSVINGNTNARAYGNVSTNGYVTTANNTASSWSNKVIGASVTQPATYYVNKGTLAQSNISGAAFLENAGDYGFRATVVVPEGYHTGETVTKDFTTGIFPAPESKANSNQMLTGYSLYDEDGRLITGSMPNQGAQNSTISTQGGTYTIPEGYHDGNGVVTASLPSASINTIAGSKAQSKPTFSIDSSTGIVTASVAATSGIAYGNVTNSGYVPSGTRSGTFSMTASSNTYAVPNGYVRTIGAISVYNNDGIKFAEGPINARDLSLKADSEIVRSINGYINSNYIVNDFDSYHFYINNQTISSTSITPYTNGVSQIVTVSEGYRDSDATITVAGVAAGAYSATQVTAVGVTPNVSGTITSIATTTAPTGTDGVDYFTINPEASVTNGNARARINTAGYLAAGNKYVNITGSVGAGTNYYITTGSFDSGVVPYPSNGNAYVNVNVVVTPLVAINANSGLITVTGTQRPNGSILNANTIPVGMTSGWIDNSAFTNLTVRAFSGGPGLNNLQLTTKSGDGSNYQNNLTITPTTSDQVVMNRNEFLVANHIIVKSASFGPQGTLDAGTASVLNNSNGNIRYYRNVSNAGYINVNNTPYYYQLNTKAGSTTTVTSTTETTLVNAGQFVTGAIKVKGGAGTLKANAAEGGIGGGEVDYNNVWYSDRWYELPLKINISEFNYNPIATNGILTTTSTIQGTHNNVDITVGSWAAEINTTIDGTVSRTPVIAVQAVPSGVTNAANAAATTTAPSSGVYVAVKSPANTTTAVANISSLTAGYTDGTEANTIINEGTKTAGAAASATTYVQIKSGAINNPSGSAAQSTPTFSFDAANRVLTASVAAKNGTAYRNVTTAGWLGTSTTGGNFQMTASSNTYTLDAATINTPSGSAKQSKPGLSFNASNGVVTATVAATSGTAYANVTGAGYVATGTKSGTFTMTAADSNTINVGLGSRTAGIQAFISAGSVTNASNHAVNASDNVKLTTEANGKYRINANAKATTTAGYIAAGTSYDTAGATYINKATASITNQTLTGTVTGTAASATAGTASVTFSNITTQTTATNYKITYNTTGGSASANSGTITGGSKTAYANVTEGYTPSTISAAATATVSNVSAVTKSATGASNNGVVYLKAATATNGSASGTATVSASGANASTSIAGMETTTANTGFIVSASANATSGAITALTKTATASVTDGYSNTGASATATASVGAVSAKTASNSNTQYIKAATISDFSAKYKAQSKPTFSINTTTGIVTASVAATTQAIYRNVTTGYVGTANTTGITFTMNASSNTYNAISGLGSATRSASIDGIAIAGLVINASNNAVNSSDAPTLAFTTAANGYYRININTVSTTTAGYISAGSTSNLNPSIYVPKGSITSQANSVTVSGKTVTYNINTVITAGYQGSGTYWVNGTKNVATGTLLAGTASVLNNANGNIRYYRNVDQAGYLARNTTAYYLQLNTKAGATYTNITTTAVTVINAGQFATGAIKVSAPAGTLAAGSAAVLNNSNGNVRYYRNVSAAGYIAANTTAYYLQLNTKAGGTFNVNSTGSTLINAGQFATGAIIAKAIPDNCTYDSNNTRLIIPTGLIIPA